MGGVVSSARRVRDFVRAADASRSVALAAQRRRCGGPVDGGRAQERRSRQAERGQPEWPAFQAFGEPIQREGYRGVLAPSASRPSHLVLCLFRDAENIAGAEPLRPPMTYRRAPAPPTGLTT